MRKVFMHSLLTKELKNLQYILNTMILITGIAAISTVLSLLFSQLEGQRRTLMIGGISVLFGIITLVFYIIVNKKDKALGDYSQIKVIPEELDAKEEAECVDRAYMVGNLLEEIELGNELNEKQMYMFPGHIVLDMEASMILSASKLSEIYITGQKHQSLTIVEKKVKEIEYTNFELHFVFGKEEYVLTFSEREKEKAFQILEACQRVYDILTEVRESALS